MLKNDEQFNDPYRMDPERLRDPSSRLEVITPDDNANLPYLTRALYVNSGGAIRVLDATGNESTFTVGNDVVLPVRVGKVFATGTTATGIVGLI